MNLIELKSYVDRAIQNAKAYGQDYPEKIIVSIQVDNADGVLWSDDIELTYDNDGMASGCVLHGWEG